MSVLKFPYATAAVFLWIGFVCAISFMEAWLKFRAPGITLPLGLGIGRIVFRALNNVEWLFVVVLMVNFMFSGAVITEKKYVLFFVPLVVLLLQTFWLLPALDARAELHISGQPVAPSYLHVYYVAGELIKTICLVLLGIKLLKTMSA